MVSVICLEENKVDCIEPATLHGYSALPIEEEQWVYSTHIGLHACNSNPVESTLFSPKHTEYIGATLILTATIELLGETQKAEAKGYTDTQEDSEEQ